MINKAILLAAGFGTRLKPLTLTTPKPLLPLNGEVLIDHQLRYLKKYGVTDVAVNLHHLGDMIKRRVGNGASYDLNIHYSVEDKILGTGGGVKKASTIFSDETLIVLNSDALLNVDISDLVEHHRKGMYAATMVVKRLASHESHTPIELNQNGEILGFGKGGYHYTGLQVVGPDLLDTLPQVGTEACLIQDGYMKLIERGIRIGGYKYDGYWNDLGTHESYDQVKKDIQKGIFKLISK